MLLALTFFTVSLVLSLAITPAIRRFALTARAVDHPGGRKTHARSTPLLGGLAIFLSLVIALLLIGFIDGYSHPEFHLPNSWQGLLLGSVLVLGLGVWDDFKRLGAGSKFLVQSVAALIAIGFGYRITTLELPWVGHLDLGWSFFPFTFLWIIGITNAFNLLDGLDGLSSGVAFTTLVSFFLVGRATHNDTTSLETLALAGSTLGFLRYNFHPASIFLGDSGSLFLGFVLSLLSVQVCQEGLTPVSLLLPMLAMGLPIVDTMFSMLRRFLRAMQAIHEKKLGGLLFSSKSMFQADRDHIHHRLLQLGVSHRRGVVLLYTISAVLGLAAYLSMAIPAMDSGRAVCAFVFAAVLGLRKLGYGELRLNRHGRLLSAFERAVSGRSSLRAAMDLVWIVIAYAGAFVIRYEEILKPSWGEAFLRTLPVVITVKMATFYFTKVYRGRGHHADVGDVIRIGKSVFLGSLLTLVITSLVSPSVSFSRGVYLIDLLLLLLLMVSSRVVDALGHEGHKPNHQEGRRALIYGADLEGSMALREIRSRAELGLTPVGFLDDNVAMSNRFFHGLPVFSNGQGLEAAVKKCQVTDIILSGEIVDAGKIEELRRFCAENPTICLRRFRVSFDVVSLDGNSLPLLTPPLPSPSLSDCPRRGTGRIGGDG